MGGAEGASIPPGEPAEGFVSEGGVEDGATDVVDQAYWTLLIFKIMRGSNSSANGREPVMKAKRMTPRAQQSPALSFVGMEAGESVVDVLSHRTSSGAQYARDPIVTGMARRSFWWE